LRHDIGRAAAAQLICELVDTVMPVEDKNTAVYDWTVDTLRHLLFVKQPDKLLTIFKIKMLVAIRF